LRARNVVEYWQDFRELAFRQTPVSKNKVRAHASSARPLPAFVRASCGSKRKIGVDEQAESVFEIMRCPRTASSCVSERLAICRGEFTVAASSTMRFHRRRAWVCLVNEAEVPRGRDSGKGSKSESPCIDCLRRPDAKFFSKRLPDTVSPMLFNPASSFCCLQSIHLLVSAVREALPHYLTSCSTPAHIPFLLMFASGHQLLIE
jgi:hypothetical protein